MTRIAPTTGNIEIRTNKHCSSDDIQYCGQAQCNRCK
jgi:hypothetical protein